MKRDFEEITLSQQCVVVIAEDDAAARAALEKAGKVYGGHMGAALAEHGIWGDPDGVIERIERHRKLGVSLFVIEFFGRDTRVPGAALRREGDAGVRDARPSSQPSHADHAAKRARGS